MQKSLLHSCLLKIIFNKIKITLLLATLLPVVSIAQNVVTIGTGTTSNANTNYPAPYGNWYWGAKHQMLIRASEMTALNACVGNITSLAFNVAVPNSVALTGFTIKMKTTTDTVVTVSFDTTGFTTVYGPQTYTETAGWNTHTFIDTFYWDGASNLLIETCFNNSSFTNNAQTYYSTTVFNSCVFYNADASGVCGTLTGTALTSRPNIRFTISPTGSPVPVLQPTKSCINYDTVFVTGSKKDSLYIKNMGCATLTVSNITKTTAEYSINTALSFSVLPGDSGKVVVTFAPTSTGNKSDTLKIFSNAGDSMVCLNGVGASPPAISLTPASFNVTISNCNDSVTQTLTIKNTGSSNLNVSSVIPGNASLGNIFRNGYVCNYSSGTVSVIDLNNGSVITTIGLAGPSPWNVSIRPDSKFAYVANRFNNNVSVINTATNTVVSTIALGGSPGGIGFTPDSKFAYIGERTNDNVKKIDCATNTIIATITNVNFNDPEEIVISPNGLFAYVATTGTGVTVINTSADTVAANIPGFNGAHSIAFTPDGAFAYISNSFNTDIWKINTSTHTLTQTITGFNQPYGLDISKDGNFVYVMDQTNDRVAIVSVSTNTIVDSVYDARLNNGWDLVVSPDGKFAYISSYSPNVATEDVMILDLATKTIINTISTDFGARGMASLKNVIAPFANVNPSSALVAPADSAVIDVEFNALGLNAGTYISNLSVISNDPVNPLLLVPCTMNVAGVSKMELTKNCFGYDTVMVAQTKKDSLYIKNTGCDTLKVTNITLQTTQYATSATTFQILPGDSGKVVVTFAPTSTGNKLDTLKIFSNAGDSVVCLMGVAVPPPVISTSPASLNATISSCNDSVSQTLTVYNTGGSNLNYTIPNFNSVPVADSCSPTVGAKNNCCAMGIYNVTFNTINNTTSESDGGYLDYSDTINTIVLPGKSYTMSIKTGASFNEYVRAWIDYNNNGVFEGSEQVFSDLNTLPNQIHSATVTISTSATQNAALRMRVASDYNFSPVPTPCSNAVYGQTEDYTLFVNKWLSASPVSGSVAPTDSSQVTVKFQSVLLNTGQYISSVTANSNDPANPTVTVPCTLTVVGNPIMSLTKNCINYDSVIVTVSKKDSLYLKNTGCDTLKVTNITTQTTQFSSSVTILTILPGDSGKVVVAFAPTSSGTKLDTLKIFSNGGDSVVCLSGEATPPPSISVNPASFNATLGCSDSSSSTLKIFNTGSGNLIFTDVVDSTSTTLFTGKPIGPLCTPITTGYCCGMGIFNVTFNTINNNSGDGFESYRNYDTVNTVVLSGNTYSLSVQTGATYNENVRVWIDYNGNGSFLDTLEQVLADLNTLPNRFHTSNVIIPDTVVKNKALRMRVASDYEFSPVPTPCANVTYSQFEDYTIFVNGAITVAVSGGTVVPGDSLTTNVLFNSVNLTAGQYTAGIYISSNDPANPLLAIPCTLTVSGMGKIALSKNCMYLDSIMEFTTKTDSVYIKNTGCDTLKITNATTQTTKFSASPILMNILPGDSGKMFVTFAPTSVGTFEDTLKIFSAVGDSLVCLSGKAYARPIESHNPDTINVTIPCAGTLTDTLTIYNTGLNDLIVTSAAIDTGKSAVFDGSGDYINRNVATLPTGSVMSVSAWIYPVAYSTDPNYTGIVSWGNRVCTGNAFLLSIQNNGRPSMATWCKDFLAPTGNAAMLNQWNHIAVVLNGTAVTLYMNGVGVNGTLAGAAPTVVSQNLAIGSTDYPGRYFNGKIDEVRIYNKALTSAEILASMNKKVLPNEAGLMGYFDFDNGTANDLTSNGNNGTFLGNATTALPNAPISPYWLNFPSVTDTIVTNDSSKFGVEFISTGLTIGQYISNIILNSNDPLNNPDTAVAILNVVGAGKMQPSKNCMYLDSIMEFTTKTDSVYVKNTGCDTLKITNITKQTANFSVTPTSANVLVGDSLKLLVTFSPTAVGTFYDTLMVFSNVGDSLICLSGKGFARSILCFNPDSFNVTLGCGDSVTLPLKVCNSGGSDLIYNLKKEGSTTGTPKILILHSGGTGTNVETELVSTGKFTAADIDIQNNPVNLTMAMLTPYNAVLVYGGTAFTNSIAKGDTLKQYVDNGGGVVIATYSLSTPWALTGGIMGATYTPFPASATQCVSGTVNLATLPDPSHPIFAGISIAPSYWTNCNYSNPPLNPGATLLASDMSGNRVVGENHFGKVVGIVAYPENLNLSPSNASAKLMFANALYYVSKSIPWLTLSPSVEDTVIPADTSVVNASFNSTGLIIGQYSGSIIISSNDPLNSVDTVPVKLTVTGAGKIALSKNCMYLDSIMEFTTKMDSVYIKNTGCDTLKITNATTQTTKFSASPISMNILPGDSGKMYVTFAPTSVGTFEDTLKIFSAVGDSLICLSGKGFARAIISENTNTINVTIPACKDSLTVPFTIYNTGGSGLNWNIITTTTITDDFDPATDTSIWSLNYGLANANCGSVSGNALWFNDGTNRIAATIDKNTTGGGTISFYLKISALGSSPCEDADAGEDVVLEYSNNGGGSWVNIATYNNAAYPNFTFISQAIPVGAQTASTRFRWRQISFSCLNCDNWALDNISVTVANPNVIPTPSIDTTIAGDSTIVSVVLKDTNLAPGSYTFEMLINSNDPLNAQDTVVVNLIIDSILPIAPVVADTAICFGSPTPDLIAVGDSIRWYSDPALTTLVSSNDTFATGMTAVGTYTYYVTNTDTAQGCQSPSDTVTLSINSAPVQPTGTDTTVCSGGAFPSLSATGTIRKWYSDAALTNLLYTGNPYITGDSAAGAYSYYVTDSTSGCPASPADTVLLTINPAATASAGTNDTICSGSTIALNGTRGGSATSSVWTTSGTGTFSDLSSLTPVYTPSSGDITAGLVALTLTTNDPDGIGPCAAAASTKFLLINPAAVVNAGADSTVCGTSPFTLSGAMSGGASSITWTTSGTGTFNSSTSLTAIYTPSVADTNAITLIITSNDPVGPCAAVADSMILTINIAATASAGADAVICAGNNYTLNGTRGGSATSSVWTTSGSGTFSDSSLLAPVYTPSSADTVAGSVVLIITTDDPTGICNAVSDTMTLTINSSPPAPSAADTTVCSDAAIPNLTATGTNIKWYSNPALTTLVGTGNSLNTGQTAPGSYTYWLTDSTASCPLSVADSATLIINQAATASAGANDTICSGSTLTLSGTRGGSATTSVWTTSGTGTFSDSSLLAPVYTPSAADITAGSVTLTLTTNDPDGVGPCAAAISSKILTINPLATVNAGADAVVCATSTHTISGATIGGAATSNTWTTSGTGTFNNANLLLPTYTSSAADNAAGAVTLIITTNDPAGPCAAVGDSMILTVNPAATVSAGTDSAICSGNNYTLIGARGGSATSSIWTTTGTGTFSDSSLLASVYTPSAADITAGSVSLIISTDDPAGPCSAVADTMLLTINPPPATPVSNDTTICFAQLLPSLTATGTNLKWYSDAGLTNLVGTGSPFASSDSAVGTHIYYVTDSVSGCPVTAADTVFIVINALPSAPVATDTSVCYGFAVPDLIATGDSIRWYSDSLLTTLVMNNDTFATTNTVVGTYTYYATQTNLITGCQGPADTVALTIKSTPVAPSVNDVVICYGSPTPKMVAVGSNIKWYSDSALTVLKFSGDSFATGDTAVGTYVYYATQTINGCESGPEIRSLIINAIPAAPTSSDTAVCVGDSVPPLVASGTNIQWYNDSTLQIPIFGGNTFFTAQTASGVYSYYANQTVNACPGPGVKITLTIRPIPGVPVASDTAVCFGSPVPNLTASGTNLQWYIDTLSSPVGAGSSFATGKTATGVYTYYVKDSLSQCPKGPSKAVTLTIDTIPVPPSASNAEGCEGALIPPLTATGTGIKWYANSSLDTLLFSGNSYNTGKTIAGSYTYYVTQSTTGCGQSAAATDTLTIRPQPTAPAVSNISSCSGTTSPNFTAAGTGILWYSDSALFTQVGTGNTFVTGKDSAATYNWYVTQTDSVYGCKSIATVATLTVNQTPSANAGSDQSLCNLTVSTLSATAPSIGTGTWSLVSGTATIDSINSPASSVTGLITGTSASLEWKVINSGCSASDTVVITIVVPPVVNAGADSAICSNQNFVLSGVVSGITTTGTWTTSGTGTFSPNANTLNAAYIPGVSGTVALILTSTNNGVCSPVSDTVSLAVNALPAAPVTTSSTVCSVQAIPDLTATGTGIKWYNDSALTDSAGTGNSFTTGKTTAGTYTYYATQTVNGCAGPSNPATLTIKYTPPKPQGTDEAICFGAPVPNLTSTGINVKWYSDTVLVNSGNTYVTGQTATGVYSYFVTDDSIGCVSPADTVTLAISTPSNAPTAASAGADSICPASSVMLYAAGTLSAGTFWSWYAGSCGGTKLGTGDSLSVAPVSTDTYFVRAEGGCDTSACKNVIVSVTKTLSTAATGIGSAVSTICKGSSATLATVGGTLGTGAMWKWYSASCGGTVAGAGDSITVSPNDTTAYYVRAEGTCNTTTCANLTLNVNPLPASPAAANQSACEGSAIPVLTATGSTIQWYANINLDTLVAAGDSLNTGKTAPGTYSYYVTQTVNGCKSVATPVTLTIIQQPVANAGADQTLCGATTATLSANTPAVGSGIWSVVSGTGSADSVFSPASSASGFTAGTTTVLSWTVTNNGCVSSDSVSIIVDVPAVVNATGDTTVCKGITASLNGVLGGTATSATWSSSGDGAFNNSSSLTATYTHGINDAASGSVVLTLTTNDPAGICPAATSSLTLTIYPIPAAPVANDMSACQGGTIPLLTATGSNVKWYSNIALDTLLTSGNSYNTGQTAIGVYTYYATQSVNGCVSPVDTVTLTIFSGTPPPITTNKSACQGAFIPLLTATGQNIKWYSDSALTNQVGTGSTLNTGMTASGIYTYYATDSLPGCPGTAAPAVLTILLPSPAPVGNDTSVCYGQPVPDLTATGTAIKWYEDPALILLTNLGNTFTTGFTDVGVYSYYITQNSNGCTSLADTITLSINPKPLVTVNTTVVNLELGQSVTLTAFNANSYVWSPATGLNTTTGQTVVASPDTSTVYTVTGTNASGCTGTATVTVKVSPVGIQLSFDNRPSSISIYPNPARSSFTIEYASVDANETIEISLLNSLGQVLIARREAATNKGKYIETIEVQKLPQGIYVLRLVSEKGILMKKVVLE